MGQKHSNGYATIYPRDLRSNSMHSSLARHHADDSTDASAVLDTSHGGRYRSHSSIGSRIRRSFRGKKKPELSAAFNLIDADSGFSPVNINLASEEQLATLNGISRGTARNIVHYRQAIGGFKRCEDLALVSGVGAALLELIRDDICVSSPRVILPSTSLDSLSTVATPMPSNTYSSYNGSTVTYSRQSSRKTPVNVNRANVFDLMGIRGINQEMAANILHRIDKKGPFTDTSGLLKVKGMTPILFERIRPYVSTEDVTISEGNNKSASLISRPSSSNFTPTFRAARQTKRPKTGVDYDVYKAVCHLSPRSVILPKDALDRDRHLRVGVWHLEGMDGAKARNLGVRDVLARTILENEISILVAYDVQSTRALSQIVSELNDPELSRVSQWCPPDRLWTQCSPTAQHQASTACLLYTRTFGLFLRESFLIEVEHSTGLVAHLAIFEMNDIVFGMVCLPSLDASTTTLNFTQLPNLTSESPVSNDKTPSIESHQMMHNGGGDYFRMQNEPLDDDNDDADFSRTEVTSSSTIQNGGGGAAIAHARDGINRVMQAVSERGVGDKCLIVGDFGDQDLARAERLNVITNGLKHPMIPRDRWHWGGAISPHRPCTIDLDLSSTNQSSLLSDVTLPSANGIARSTSSTINGSAR